jgi:hypothetical protein
MNKITNIYTILATNLKGRLSGRTGYDWEDKIKIDLVWIWTLGVRTSSRVGLMLTK